jgi:hypothetical protein
MTASQPSGCIGYLWEVAGTVADQKTCLAASTIANNNELLRVRGRLSDGRVSCVGGTIGAHGAIAVSLAGRAHWLADRCDGCIGRLGTLLAAQVVVVLWGRRRHVDAVLCVVECALLFLCTRHKDGGINMIWGRASREAGAAVVVSAGGLYEHQY